MGNSRSLKAAVGNGGLPQCGLCKEAWKFCWLRVSATAARRSLECKPDRFSKLLGGCRMFPKLPHLWPWDRYLLAKKSKFYFNSFGGFGCRTSICKEKEDFYLVIGYNETISMHNFSFSSTLTGLAGLKDIWWDGISRGIAQQEPRGVLEDWALVVDSNIQNLVSTKIQVTHPL